MRISNDEFQIWKDNEVTKALFEHLKISHQETLEVKISSYDPNLVLVENARKNERCYALEEILNWSPIDERSAT